MIPAIADASTVDLNSPATWAVLIAAGILALCVLIHEAYRRAPVQEAEPSRLDRLDRPHCTVNRCDDPVQVHVHAGDSWWPFCTGHGAPYLSADLRDGAK